MRRCLCLHGPGTHLQSSLISLRRHSKQILNGNLGILQYISASYSSDLFQCPYDQHCSQPNLYRWNLYTIQGLRIEHNVDLESIQDLPLFVTWLMLAHWQGTPNALLLLVTRISCIAVQNMSVSSLHDRKFSYFDKARSMYFDLWRRGDVSIHK